MKILILFLFFLFNIFSQEHVFFPDETEHAYNSDYVIIGSVETIKEIPGKSNEMFHLSIN